MSALRICSGCDRHVREGVCPFCGAVVARGPLVTVPNVARAVLVAGIATAAVAATASCFAGGYGGPPPGTYPENSEQDAGASTTAPTTANDGGK